MIVYVSLYVNVVVVLVRPFLLRINVPTLQRRPTVVKGLT